MQGSGRWIGLDLSKKTYEMRYFDQEGKVAGSGGLTTKAGRAKLYAKLKPEDIVALEANSLAFVMERQMRAIGCTVVILNASQLSVIYSSTKKTDKEDAVKLARLIKIYEKDCLFSAAKIVRLKNTAEFAYRQTSLINCTFSFHYKSAPIRQSSLFDKGCGCRILRKIYRQSMCRRIRNGIGESLSKSTRH